MKTQNKQKKPDESHDVKQRDEVSKIAWHPAFVEAIQLELEEYRDSLEFIPEFPLTKEPLKIDCIVIKKDPDAVIKKNIAVIFRDVNILEYKNPQDYISVEETMTGIYTVKGDILPIQIIDSRRLSEKENLWLKDLHDKLDPDEIERVLSETRRRGKAVRLGAYLDVIIRANKDSLQGAIQMSDAATIMGEIIEKVGLPAKWKDQFMAEGMVKGKAEGKESEALAIAKNMVNQGYPLEAILSVTMLAPEKVKAL